MTETQTAPEVTSQEPKLTEDGAQVARILTMAQSDPNIAALPEVQKLQEQVKRAQEKRNANPKTEIQAEPTVAEFRKEDAATKSEVKDEEPQEQKRGVWNANKRAAPVAYKDLDEYSQDIEKRFGIKDPATFGRTAEKWRNDSQRLPEIEDRANGLEKLLSDAPDVIYNSLTAYHKGEDWMGTLKNELPQFDFTKPFEKQRTEVVGHYFKGKFSEEDLKDLTNDVAQNAIEVAKEKFNFTKNKIEQQRTSTLEEADKKARAIKASVEGSVDKFDDSFPEFDARKKSEIKQILLSGDLNSVFYNKDGTYRPDAVKRLALALYGEEDATEKTAKAKTKAASEAETKALMDSVNRGKATAPATTSQVGQQETVPEKLQSLLKGVNKKPFY